MPEIRPGNPYVGPRPFQTGEILYGRDREVLGLLDLLIAERIVLLYSPSGAGKTSLIQAGLIPALEEEGFLPLPVMRVSLEPPPEQLAELPSGINRYVLSLLLSLEEGLPEGQQTPLEELVEMTLAEYLEQRKPTPNPSREGNEHPPGPPQGGNTPSQEGNFRVVLIFDQFEEILTLDPTDRAVKMEFFAQVGAALRYPDRYVLFAMREEFPAGLDPYLRPIPTRLSTTFRLELLGQEAALQALQEPAQQAGVPFIDDAAVKLVDDLRRVRVQQPDGATMERLGLSVEPVQLQVVCYRLWDHLPPNTTQIDETHIQEAGDVNTALAGYYADRARVTAENTGVPERAIREWFDKQLITEQGIRGQVLRGSEHSQGLDNQAIAPLVDAHLVRAENRRGATWYELAHDRLIEPVRTNNAEWFLANLSALQRQADLWQDQGRSNGLLLSDEALEEAERWAEHHQEELLPVEQEFLTACREARARFLKEKWAQRLIRNLLIGAVITTVITIIFAVVAYYQRSEAQRLHLLSIAQSLAVQALHQQDLGQDELGALLARQAYLFNQLNEGTMLSQIDNALRTVLNTSHFCRILRPHEEVVSIALSSDGQALAVGTRNGKVQLWNLDKPGSPSVVLHGHKRAVWSVAFSPDGQILASSSWDKTIRLWNLQNLDSTPTVLHGHKGIVFSVVFSPNGQTLASAASDGTIRLWDILTPDAEPRVLRGHQESVNTVAFSPDGQDLASGSSDMTIRLWDLQNPGVEPQILRGHEKSVNTVAFSPDGLTLASGSSDRTVRLWELQHPDMHPTVLQGHEKAVFSVAFSPNGRILTSGSGDNALRLWDLQNLDAGPVVLTGHEDWILSIEFSPDKQFLASGSQDETIRLWETDKQNVISTVLQGQTENIRAIAFSPDGHTLVSGSADKTLRLWDLNTPDAPSAILQSHASPISTVAFSPDGKILASGDDEGNLQLWNLNTPEATPVILQGHTGSIRSLEFSPNSQILASGGEDNTVRLWNVNAPDVLPTVLRGHRSSILSMGFSPDGKTLAVGSSSGVSGQGGSVRIWSLRSPDLPLKIFQGQGGNHFSVAFSPDGKFLASSSQGKSIWLWKPYKEGFSFLDLLKDLLPIVKKFFILPKKIIPSKLLSGHKRQVISLAFDPEGEILASGSEDQTIRLWNPHNPTSPITLYGHESQINALAFSPNGKVLASGSQDGNIIIWAPTEILAEEVCQKVGRNLTRDEWREFVGEAIPYEQTCFQVK